MATRDLGHSLRCQSASVSWEKKFKTHYSSIACEQQGLYLLNTRTSHLICFHLHFPSVYLLLYRVSFKFGATFITTVLVDFTLRQDSKTKLSIFLVKVGDETWRTT